ncbi:MAG: glucose PTS transporter subunit EIIB [Leptotrichiaceae bacterium]|jgi:glucose-like phosphotransferase system IIB component|nr:PTS transporter subunit EIIB [Leptotrichiaceae bacterium]MBP9876281.1 PTS transporter subunit EIIB [Leptotrichiaceae bacterium]
MFEKIKEKILGNQDGINGVEILEASKIMNALGGRGNIDEIDSCVTRLRLKVESNEAVDDGELEKLGALGVIKPSEGIVQVVMGDKSASVANSLKELVEKQPLEEAANFVIALGGSENIEEIDSCTTRLRLKVINNDVVNDQELERLGALSVIKPSEGLVQVVLGDKSTEIAEEMKKILG